MRRKVPFVMAELPHRHRAAISVQAVGAPVRLVAGLLSLVVAAAGVVWLADFVQLAGNTTEPQLVEVRVLLFGVPVALLWAVGTVVAFRVLQPLGVTKAFVWMLALAPWLVLAASMLDVYRDVCVRPGGRCG